MKRIMAIISGVEALNTVHTLSHGWPSALAIMKLIKRARGLANNAKTARVTSFLNLHFFSMRKTIQKKALVIGAILTPIEKIGVLFADGVFIA